MVVAPQFSGVASCAEDRVLSLLVTTLFGISSVRTRLDQGLSVHAAETTSKTSKAVMEIRKRTPEYRTSSGEMRESFAGLSVDTLAEPKVGGSRKWLRGRAVMVAGLFWLGRRIQSGLYFLWSGRQRKAAPTRRVG